jgi:hypothetical protein
VCRGIIGLTFGTFAVRSNHAIYDNSRFVNLAAPPQYSRELEKVAGRLRIDSGELAQECLRLVVSSLLV